VTESKRRNRSEGLGVARNSALLGAGNVIALAVAFGSMILITDRLGADRYGLLVGAQRFIGIFAVIVYFGMHPLVVRASATGSRDVGILLGTILVLRTTLGLVAGLLVWIAVATTNYLPDHGLLLFGVAVVQVPMAFAEVFTAVCEGRERMGRVAWITLIRTLTTFLCICVAVFLDGDIGLFVAAYIVGGLSELGAALLLSRDVVPGLRLRVQVDRLLPILREAVPFLLVGLGYTALRGLDVVILARFSSIPEVSRYGAALNFIDLITMFALMVQRALLPVFSRLQLTRAANDLASNSMSLSFAVLIPASAGLALLADSAVLLYPSGEYEAAGPVLIALCGALVWLGPSIVCATFLTGAGRLRPILGAYAVALPVQAVVSLLLVADYAAVGVAIGTVVGNALMGLLLLRSARGLGMAIAHRVILRQVLATGLMALAVTATQGMPVVISLLVGFLTYVGALWMIAPVESPERRLVADVVSRWRTG
jgi:O-antigen/teichoic acid export membrane protein